MKRFSLVALLPTLLGCVLISSSATAADEVTLRYKYDKETPLVYATSVTSDLNQNALGQKIKTTLDNRSTIKWTFVKEGEKGDEIEVETVDMKINMQLPQVGAYTFDSTKEDNDEGGLLGAQLTPMYKALSNAKLTLVATERGKAVELRGYAELMKQALAGNALAAQFAGGGSQEAALQGYAETLPVLPEKAVGVGDTWEAPFEAEMPQMGKAKGKRVYKLTDIEETEGGDVATIEITTEMKFEVKVEQPAAVSGTFEVSNSKGTLKFDIARGRILDLVSTYTLGGNLQVTANGQNIPITHNQVQTVKKTLVVEDEKSKD